jgi:hypothetical protein
MAWCGAELCILARSWLAVAEKLYETSCDGKLSGLPAAPWRQLMHQLMAEHTKRSVPAGYSVRLNASIQQAWGQLRARVILTRAKHIGGRDEATLRASVAKTVRRQVTRHRMMTTERHVIDFIMSILDPRNSCDGSLFANFYFAAHLRTGEVKSAQADEEEDEEEDKGKGYEVNVGRKTKNDCWACPTFMTAGHVLKRSNPVIGLPMTTIAAQSPLQATETEIKLGVSTAPADTGRILRKAMLTRVAPSQRVTDRPATKVNRKAVDEIARCKARRVKDKELKLKRA